MKKTLVKRKVLSVILGVIMVIGIIPIAVFAGNSLLENSTSSSTDYYKIVFLDCGRKYFSVSSIKSIIDNASSAGMTHVQLAFGNEGLRFLLDDMSLTVGTNSYKSDTVKAGIKQGNQNYYNFTVNELTQTEMDSIIAYAKTKHIGIIPCLNSPGHMNAILDCMEYCGLGSVCYNNSSRTVDITNSTAVSFTQAFIKKYVEYFASKGCELFNIGADEFANDVYTRGSMGFGNLINNGKYSYYVNYVNTVAGIIKDAGMIPMAFNDGIYFNSYTSGGTLDTDIIICYWSSGWSGYYLTSATNLKAKGFKMINTNGDYYWVLGNTELQCSTTRMSGFDDTNFQGTTVSSPDGSMFCIWCDDPDADTDTNVVSYTADVIATFGTVLPETEVETEEETEEETETPEDPEEPEEIIQHTELDFNDNWKFYLGNPTDAEESSYNDSSWSSVTLPYDFSIIQSFTTSGEAESGFLPGGTGWYRKSFTIDESYENKDIIISFDGVYSDAYVYVNGTYVGENHYGYNCFAFDISDYLVCDGETENIIAVKAVNNIPSSRFYSGSGIYRDVTLSITNSVHAELDGIAITTPDIASGKGTVNVSTEIVNSGKASANVTVKADITRKGSSTVLSSASNTVTLSAGDTLTAVCVPEVSSPELWSPDSPELYTVTVTLTVNGIVVDSVSDNFGFRYYSFDSTNGFYLNGEAVKLNGVCLHHDQGGLGSAAYNDAIYRQLVKMKEMGANAIRTSHNPADKDLIEMCDSLGLMVIEELFDGWSVAKNENTYDFSYYFNTYISSSNGIYGATSNETWAEYVTKAVVRRDRNNPSVIMWSIGNEIQEGASAASTFPTIAQNLINWIKTEDNTRKITLGDNTKSTGNSSVLGQVIDVVINNGGIVGFNYASASQLSTLNSVWGAIYSSETSSATNSRGIYSSQSNNTGVDGEYHLTSYDTSAVGWGMTAHQSLYNTYTADYIAGEFVWTGFDYIGEPTPYNGINSGSVTYSGAIPNSSYFGIVDTAGFEKDTYYLYRSQWNKNANTLHLVTAWDNNNMYVDSDTSITPVVVYSNAPTVELYLNGALIGTAERISHTSSAGHTYYTYSVVSNNSSVCIAVNATGAESLYATFNVVYTAGTLTAKAYDESGNDITSSCSGKTSVTTPSTAAKLSVKLDNSDIYNGGLAYIAVEILDENGNPVTTAENLISISVSNGTLLAVDNGDQATTAKYQQSSVLSDSHNGSINAFAGKAMFIVDGTATVTVSCEGMNSVTYTVGQTELEPIKGDFNNDGEVNTLDLVRIRNYLANYDYEKEKSTGEIYIKADINGDETINLKDLVALRKILAEQTNLS